MNKKILKLKSLLSITFKVLVVVCIAAFVRQKYFPTANELQIRKIATTNAIRKQIRDQISEAFLKNEKIEKINIQVDGLSTEARVNYTFDSELQSQAEKLLRQYKPDYAAIVAIDASTGKVLALTSFSKDSSNTDNLALKSDYPAASIFKIIPAAAVVNKYNLDPNLLIGYNGGNHTLYRKNVMGDSVNRWTRFISLKEAFAKSVNTAFAKLTFENLKPQDLREYADRFYFNKKITTDFSFQMGSVVIPNEESYELAEVASGFNQTSKLSPVQGAMIAAAIADDGIMRMPYIVESIVDQDGKIVFQPEPYELSQPLTKQGAQKLRELMGATVTQGTGRKSFRSLLKQNQKDPLEVGGKTGSLTSDILKGKTDWFIGYAMRGNKKIAIAALTVNKEFWTVKAAYLAQNIFQNHFKVIKGLDVRAKKNQQPAGLGIASRR